MTNALYYYFPSIAASCASDILLGFSGSSANTNINAYMRVLTGNAVMMGICFSGSF